MELPGNVYWEAGNVNSNQDTGHAIWDCGDVNSNSGNNDRCSNSKPGILPTPDKVSLFDFMPVEFFLSSELGPQRQLINVPCELAFSLGKIAIK